MPELSECELSSELICSLAAPSPAKKTRRMAMESSFITFLSARYGIASNRQAIQDMVIMELITEIRIWARAVSTDKWPL